MNRFFFFIIFLTVVFGVYGGIHYYIYRRCLLIIPVTPQSKDILRIVICFLAALYPVGRILRGYTGHWIFSPFILSGAVWMGLVLYIFIGLIVIDIGRLTFWITGAGQHIPLNIRPILRYLTAIVLGMFVLTVGAVSFINARNSPIITRLDVPIPGLPGNLIGLKLVQITDLHLGAIVSTCSLDRITAMIKPLKPDLIVITGDLIDENADRLNGIKDALTKLNAPLGVYAVTGNHEFYTGVEQSSAFIESAGIQVLRNMMVTVADSLQIIGLDDPTGSRQMGEGGPDLEKALTGYRENLPSILLIHQPVGFEQFARKGINLVLSGHTHGGQLWPINYITRLFYSKPDGLFNIGESILYVSKGAGTWGPPMRFKAPPEIVLIRLVRP